MTPTGRKAVHVSGNRPVGLVVLGALACVLTLAGCGGGDGDRQLTVFGASSLTEALESYGDSFDGAAVRSSFAGSDQLAAQIRQGAPADVFASADSSYPARLHAEGLVEKPVVFARNRLVVVEPADAGLRSLAELARPGTAIAVGDRSVPVGAYTREALDRLPAARRRAILANVRSEEPEVSSVLAKVTSGAADAGFVYATDAMTVAGEVRTVPVPRSLQPEVAYAAAVAAGSDQQQAARLYVEGLLDGEGASDLRRAGFLPPP